MQELSLKFVVQRGIKLGSKINQSGKFSGGCH